MTILGASHLTFRTGSPFPLGGDAHVINLDSLSRERGGDSRMMAKWCGKQKGNFLEKYFSVSHEHCDVVGVLPRMYDAPTLFRISKGRQEDSTVHRNE